LLVAKMVLCGGAAPVVYWTAGTLPKGSTCLIHYDDDQLCPLDLLKLRDLDLMKVVKVTVPHPKLAYLLLGRSLLSYMHLCVSDHTIGDVGRIPDTIHVMRSGAVPSKPGELMERLCRLGMTARMHDAYCGAGKGGASRGSVDRPISRRAGRDGVGRRDWSRSLRSFLLGALQTCCDGDPPDG